MRGGWVLPVARTALADLPALHSDARGTGMGVVLRGRAGAGAEGGEGGGGGVVGGQGEEGGGETGAGEYHVVFWEEVVGLIGIEVLALRFGLVLDVHARDEMKAIELKALRACPLPAHPQNDILVNQMHNPAHETLVEHDRVRILC